LDRRFRRHEGNALMMSLKEAVQSVLPDGGDLGVSGGQTVVEGSREEAAAPARNPRDRWTRDGIRERVSRIRNLGVRPDLALRLTRLLDHPSTLAVDVGREVEKDPALAGQVLRLVNSGFYGLPSTVKSVQHATMLLGFRVMKTLLLSAPAAALISRTAPGIWLHSIACSHAGFRLAQLLGLEEPEEFGTVGLLHDIGKGILAEAFPEECRLIQERIRQDDLLWSEAEQLVMGVTHAEVASWLLEKWQFPPTMIAGIGGHHAVDADAPEPAAALAHVADVLVRARAIGSGGDEGIPELNPVALEILGIPETGIGDVLMQTEGECSGLAALTP